MTFKEFYNLREGVYRLPSYFDSEIKGIYQHIKNNYLDTRFDFNCVSRTNNFPINVGEFKFTLSTNIVKINIVLEVFSDETYQRQTSNASSYDNTIYLSVFNLIKTSGDKSDVFIDVNIKNDVHEAFGYNLIRVLKHELIHLMEPHTKSILNSDDKKLIDDKMTQYKNEYFTTTGIRSGNIPVEFNSTMNDIIELLPLPLDKSQKYNLSEFIKNKDLNRIPSELITKHDFFEACFKNIYLYKKLSHKIHEIYFR